MSQYGDRLKQHDEAFSGAQRRNDLGELPEPGDYQGIIDRFDFIEAKSNGRLYLKTEVKLVGEGVDGWPVDILNDLEDAERYEYLKTHLHRLGVDTDTFVLSKIETYLPELCDLPVLVNIYEAKNGNSYASITKRLSDEPMRQPGGEVPADPPEAPAATGGGAAGGGDEDIPFAASLI